jgi:hypothetical protein
VRANAEVVVTFNIRDFPEPALTPYDIPLVARRSLDRLAERLDLALACRGKVKLGAGHQGQGVLMP